MKKTILFFTLLTLLIFSSCQKESSKKDDFKKEKWEKEKGEWEKEKKGKECFYLVYPVTFVMPDGSDITLNDDKDTAIKDWYTANPNSKEKPQLNYPVEIFFEEDKSKTITIDNEDAMIEVKKKCKDEGWEKEKCFYLVYPLTFTMPDGSDITLNNDKDMGIKDWYIANPDSKEKPQLQYPVQIIFEEDKTVVVSIANEEEMINAKKSCKD